MASKRTLYRNNDGSVPADAVWDEERGFYAAPETQAPTVATVTLRIVREETVPLTGAAQGLTFGQQIDAMLADHASAKTTVQSLTLDIAPDYWADMIG